MDCPKPQKPKWAATHHRPARLCDGSINPCIGWHGSGYVHYREYDRHAMSIRGSTDKITTSTADDVKGGYFLDLINLNQVVKRRVYCDSVGTLTIRFMRRIKTMEKDVLLPFRLAA